MFFNPAETAAKNFRASEAAEKTRAQAGFVTGHDFRGCGKTRSVLRFVTGHDFSRAIILPRSMWASAPAALEFPFRRMLGVSSRYTPQDLSFQRRPQQLLQRLHIFPQRLAPFLGHPVDRLRLALHELLLHRDVHSLFGLGELGAQVAVGGSRPRAQP